MKRVVWLLLILGTLITLITTTYAQVSVTAVRDTDLYYSIYLTKKLGCKEFPVPTVALPRKGIINELTGEKYDLFLIPEPEAVVGIYDDMPQEAFLSFFSYCECGDWRDVQKFIKENFPNYYIFSPAAFHFPDGRDLTVFGVGYGVGESEIVPILKRPYILDYIDGNRYYSEETLIPMHGGGGYYTHYSAEVHFYTDCPTRSYLIYATPKYYQVQIIRYLLGDHLYIVEGYPDVVRTPYEYSQLLKQATGLSDVGVEDLHIRYGDVPSYGMMMLFNIGSDVTPEQIIQNIETFNAEYTRQKKLNIVDFRDYTILEGDKIYSEFGEFKDDIIVARGILYFKKVRIETEENKEATTETQETQERNITKKEKETEEDLTCMDITVSGKDKWDITYPNPDPIMAVYDRICNNCDTPRTIYITKSIAGASSSSYFVEGERPFSLTIPSGECRTVLHNVEYLPYRNYTIKYTISVDAKVGDAPVFRKTLKETTINVRILGDLVCDPEGENVLNLIKNSTVKCEEGCVRTQNGAKCYEALLKNDITPDDIPKDLAGKIAHTKEAVDIDPLSVLMVGGLGTLTLFANEWPLVKDLIPLVPGGLFTLVVTEVAFLGLTYYLWKRCGAPGSNYAEMIMLFGLPFIGDLPFLLYSGGYCLYEKLKGEE